MKNKKPGSTKKARLNLFFNEVSTEREFLKILSLFIL